MGTRMETKSRRPVNNGKIWKSSHGGPSMNRRTGHAPCGKCNIKTESHGDITLCDKIKKQVGYMTRNATNECPQEAWQPIQNSSCFLLCLQKIGIRLNKVFASFLFGGESIKYRIHGQGSWSMSEPPATPLHDPK